MPAHTHADLMVDAVRTRVVPQLARRGIAVEGDALEAILSSENGGR